MRNDQIGDTEKGLVEENEAKFVRGRMSKLRSEGGERIARQRFWGHLEGPNMSQMGDKWRSGTGEEWEVSLAGWADREGPGKPG